MSLPNYLARIKSSGLYRFVWDKSVVPTQVAETLRLVVGYSEKGPFNTPVYIDNAADFINLFGGINKKMERKGIYFNRLALQALDSAPILALNLKPFNDEKVEYVTFDGSEMSETQKPLDLKVTDLYDRNRFWTLNEDSLPEKIENHKYITLTSTDTHTSACTIFMRKVDAKKNRGYDMTVAEWYNANPSLEKPDYFDAISKEKLSDMFVEIYVFKGKISEELYGDNGTLNSYFTLEGKLKTDYKNAFGEFADALDALSQDPNSNFINKYRGITLPYFKDANGNYISIDVLFNSDHALHKMLMKLDETYFDDKTPDSIVTAIKPTNISLKSKKEVFDNYYNEQYYNSLNDEITKISDAKSDIEKTISNLTEELKQAQTKGEEFTKTKDLDAATDTLAKYEKQLKDVTSKKHQITDKKNKAAAGLSNLSDEEFINKYTNGEMPPSVCANIENLYINGYTYESLKGENGMLKGQDLQNKILEQLNDKGIRTALTNRVDTEYRYLVDTFQSYVTPNCKSKLSSIAKEKDNAFAILNFPTMETFIDYESSGNHPYYNPVTKQFDIELITEKSNFSLPSEVDGASWCGFFTPVKFSDGTMKEYVPSAALVSNNFMEKYGARQPYYIVAGPNYGRINYSGMIGPDYNYDRTDLDVLEPMGVNAIIYVPRKGTFINSNQTAKQKPVSGLSKIHIRELVIYLQDEIESMLQDYQWELNTQTLRNTIKAKADTICERVMHNGGLYAFTCVCDASNNTPEIIDNEMIILDVAIEPARGAGKMVQTLTIHKTGGITSK